MSSFSKIKKGKRIVVKIGSSTITDGKCNIHESWLKSIADDIKVMLADSELIIVTSGAAALGSKYIQTAKAKMKLEEKQAACAIGQIKLMEAFVKAFKPLNVAQILLTLSDTESRNSYLNARSSMRMLIKNNAIPVINENDVVTTAELRYGDNDRLSARVAEMLNADQLIILSDIDGLYTANPNKDKTAKHLDKITEITPEIEKMAGGAGSDVGTGGMITKIEAAKIAVRAGCDTIITNGNVTNPLKKLFNGESKFTLFEAQVSPLTARKSWIVSGVNPKGEVEIDEGAATALSKGKSLLPAGATAIWGEFERGDLIIIRTKNAEIARGLTAYSSNDAKRIFGKKTSEIEKILGYSGRSELVHRDNMVVTSTNH